MRRTMLFLLFFITFNFNNILPQEQPYLVVNESGQKLSFCAKTGIPAPDMTVYVGMI